MRKLIAVSLAAIVASGCASKNENEYTKFQEPTFDEQKEVLSKIKIKKEPPKPPPKKVKKIPKFMEEVLNRRITLNADGIPYSQFINVLSLTTGVNIYTDRPVEFPIKVSFHNTPLKDVLTTITEPYGFRYDVGNRKIKVITYETKLFKLYIPPALRKLNASLEAVMSISGSSSPYGYGYGYPYAGTTGTTGTTSRFVDESKTEGKLKIENELEIDLWKQVEETIKNIIQDEENTSVEITYSTEETGTDVQELSHGNVNKSVNDLVKGTQEKKGKGTTSQGERIAARKYQRNEGAVPGLGGISAKGSQMNLKGLESLVPKREHQQDEKSQIKRENVFSSTIEKKGSVEQKHENVKEEKQGRKRDIKVQIVRKVGSKHYFRPFVKVDRLNGIVMVKARPKTVEKIGEYIETLNKVLNKEILIELEIVEFTADRMLEYGVNWDVLLSKALGNDYNVRILQSFQYAYAGDTGLNMNVYKSDGTFSSIIRALSRYGRVKVLSTPRVTTLNNQPAIVRFGKDRILIYPRASSTSQLFGTTTNVAYQATTITVDKLHIVSEGFTLFVLPRYNEYTKDIILNIIPIFQNLDDKSSQDIDSKLEQMMIADPTKYVSHPVPLSVITKQLSAIAKLKEGEVIILGGLSSKMDSA
ncbi:MAG: hypothetical protein GXO45_04750, partial [Aquificae bacterium]|nr:hypothetical protein [Aquificota bacterium]